MKPEVIKLSLSANVPCGFVDSEVKINANAKMVDFLGLNKDAPEMLTLLEKIHTEKSPFFIIINLVSDYKKRPPFGNSIFYRFLVTIRNILALSFTPTSSCFYHRWSMSMACSLMRLPPKSLANYSLIKSGKYCFSQFIA